MKTLAGLLSIATLPLTLTGCMAADPAGPAHTAAGASAPAVLTESLYQKDASGSISEDDLQTVLSAPIDLVFPARVGVVPLAKAFDPSEQPSLGVRSVASQSFASALRGHSNYAQVSDVSTEVNHPGGIEGLRAIAARYRLRYLILYSQRIEDDTHLNAWAWSYPTLIGMFVTPGVTVKSRGVTEADLVDVRTGTVLFSVVEPFEVEHAAWVTSAGREHRLLQEKAAASAAKGLASKVMAQTNALVAAAIDPASEQQDKPARVVAAPIAMH